MGNVQDNTWNMLTLEEDRDITTNDLVREQIQILIFSGSYNL